MPDPTPDLVDQLIDAAAELDIPAEAPDPAISPDEPIYLDTHDIEGNPMPWAQQKDESDRDYALFVYYLSLPRHKRTFAEVARHYDLKPSSAQRAAKQHNWLKRSRAWDTERDVIYQQEVFDRMREMGERHGNILERSIMAMALPLEAMAQRMEEDPEGVAAELGEKSIVQLHNLAIKSARALPNMMQTERLARGLPTEITQNIHSGQIEHVYNPDISEIAEILRGLHDAGAIQFDGAGAITTGEIVDAEVEPVYPDEDPEP